MDRRIRGGKQKKRRRWLTSLAAWLLASVTLCAGAPAVLAAGDGLNAERPRQLQSEIVEWKRAAGGENLLLAGDVLDSAGGAGSDWVAFNISRIGMEDNQAAYLSRLRDAVEKIYADTETSAKRYNLSDLHRLVLTVEACGGDPTSFGTDPEGNPIDLLEDSTWNSIWGDPGRQGINGYIWALLTVDSKGWEEPEGAQWTREDLVTSLLSRQLADGGFGLVLTDDSDVDLTSMALTALAPYGNSDKTYTFTSAVTKEEVTVTVDQAAEKAFACMAGMQKEDGTMLTYGLSTSESTSWAMVALAAWGREPETDQAFIKNGNTLLDGLEIFSQEDGSIAHSLDDDALLMEEEGGGTGGNNMASYQAVYALEAVCRLREGKCGLFDLSDAPTVTEEEINEAGASLPELVEEEEKTGAEVQAETSDRMVFMTAIIAAAVVLVAAVFVVLVLRDRKKKKAGKALPGAGDGEEPSWEDDDEDW